MMKDINAFKSIPSQNHSTKLLGRSAASFSAQPRFSQLSFRSSSEEEPLEEFPQPEFLNGENLSGIPAKRRRSAVDTAGNSRGLATSLGLFPGSRTVRDAVSRKDADYYSFTIDTVSNVKVAFLNRSKNSIFKAVLNGDGSIYTSRRLPQAGNIQPREDALDTYRRLRPGTYYLKFQSRSAGDSAYKLDITINPAPIEDCGCGT